MDVEQLQHIKEYPYRQRDHLDYPEITLYQAIAASASKYPDDTALEFYGRKISYSRFLRDIDRAADAFSCCGIPSVRPRGIPCAGSGRRESASES